jgi:hypothetical protein
MDRLSRQLSGVCWIIRSMGGCLYEDEALEGFKKTREVMVSFEGALQLPG